MLDGVMLSPSSVIYRYRRRQEGSHLRGQEYYQGDMLILQQTGADPLLTPSVYDVSHCPLEHRRGILTSSSLSALPPPTTNLPFRLSNRPHDSERILEILGEQ